MENQKKADLVVASIPLKNKLKERIDKLGLSYNDIVEDAKRLGAAGITKSSLSVYFNYNVPKSGCLSQKSLLWLCIRYGIDVRLIARTVDPFNEEEQLKKLKIYFPDAQ